MANLKRENVLYCKGNESPILKCSGQIRESEFYNSWSRWNGNKMLYCKSCVSKIYEWYLKNNSSIQSALYFTCQVINIPFIKEVYEKVNNRIIEDKKRNRNNTNIIGLYINELFKYKSKKELWRDFSDTDVDFSEINTSLKSRDATKKELEQFELDWGKQPDVLSYRYLDYRYGEYTKDKTLTVAQEALYRQLCLVELAKRRKEENNESTKEEQDMMIKLMDKLKISNFEEKKEKPIEERIVEKQIWEIENTEPAEVVDKEEYKDYLDINKNWGKHILRAVKNIISGDRQYPDVANDEWD